MDPLLVLYKSGQSQIDKKIHIKPEISCVPLGLKYTMSYRTQISPAQQSDNSASNPSDEYGINSYRFSEQIQDFEQFQDINYPRFSKKLTNPNEIKSKASRGIAKQKRQTKPTQKQATDEVDQEYEKKVLQKKIMALVLLKEGKLTLDSLNNKISSYHQGLTIDANRYKTLYDSFCNDIMRALQKYIEVYWNIQAETLSTRELKVLYKIITNCKVSLSPEAHSTLVSFLQFVFELKKVELIPSSLYDLYSTLVEIARRINGEAKDEKIQGGSYQEANSCEDLPKRKKTYRKKRPKQPINSGEIIRQVCAMWSQEYEQFLIKAYNQTQSFAQISQLFCEEFPENRELWIRVAFKSRLRRSIRQCIKNLKATVSKRKSLESLPPLAKIDQKRQTMIFCRASGRNLRLLLLELRRGRLKMNLKDLILMVNQFIQSQQQKEAAKEEQFQYEQQLQDGNGTELSFERAKKDTSS